jgi:tetratricopeptide (TPR) repeat protein
MKKLIGELHRRSLWQVLGIYLAGSWIALQVVDVVNQNFGLPDWVAPFALILLVIGLPIVLATAFVQEGMGSKGARDAAAPTEPAASASEVSRVAELDAPVADPGEPRTHHRLFTWRNALVGGGLAFIFLAILTVGYLFMRSAGIGPAGTLVAKGVLEANDPIILAEFEDGTGDPSLAAAVTEALRIDLAQSPTVTLMQPDEIAGALQRMQRDPEETVDVELGRELAVREGVKAVVAGEVNTLGGAYVLSARLVDAESGEDLVPLRETAKDSTEIIEAVDRLSKGLRERIGESLQSVQSKTPLRRVSTASLPALRKYTQGLREVNAGDQYRGVQLMREAVEIDTSFAVAHLDIAIYLNNMGIERSAQLESLGKAFQFRHNLPDAERYYAEASYYSTATGESQKAINAYRSLLEVEPDHPDGANDLGFEYMILRDYEQALEMYRLHLENHPETAFTHINAMQVLVNMGRIEEAREQWEAFREANPDHLFVPWSETGLAMAEGDYGTARAQTQALREQVRGNLGAEQAVTIQLWRIAWLQGRLEEAERYGAEVLDLADEMELGAEYLESAATIARMRASVGRPAAEIVAPIDRALASYPLDALDPLDRPYLQLASLLAGAGRVEDARTLLESFERDVPVQYQPMWEAWHHAARGRLAEAEGRLGVAADEYRATDTRGCVACAMTDLAALQARQGDAQAAIATYEEYLATPSWLKLPSDAEGLARTYEHLGQLYDEAGDQESAAKYYALFVELWQEADLELQPRVQAAQARLEEIVRERG